jgi:cytosine/adenosine deaminase-related metal-dependent hydrolase
MRKPRSSPRGPDDLLDALVFGDNANRIRDVFVGGRQVIDRGRHLNEVVIHAAYRVAAKRLTAAL